MDGWELEILHPGTLLKKTLVMMPGYPISEEPCNKGSQALLNLLLTNPEAIRNISFILGTNSLQGLFLAM